MEEDTPSSAKTSCTTVGRYSGGGGSPPTQKRREEEGWGIVGGVTSSKNSDQDIK